MAAEVHNQLISDTPRTVLLATKNCEDMEAPLTALSLSGLVELVELDGSSLEARIEEVTPSLVIAGPGFNPSVIEALSRKKSVSQILPPFLRCVTSAETEEQDLYLGFDDFILASCSAAELEKRIKRLTHASRKREASIINAGPITIDMDKYRVTVSGKPIKLAWMEFQLLRYLLLNIGSVFTREDLLTSVWGHKRYGHTRTVDVHIRRLRHKLGAQASAYIRTVNNVGYGFIETTANQP
jgi:two-component system alkaline phosphatase synthesis response regulator PhoP